MGLEPTTFCMATSRERSLLFASVRWGRFVEPFVLPSLHSWRTQANCERCHCCHDHEPNASASFNPISARPCSVNPA
jgi:hypothetical protein